MASRRFSNRSLLLLFLGAAVLFAQSSGPVANGPLPGPFPLFPADNWWNLDVSTAPVDPGSAGYIGFIGTTRALHPDFGGDASATGPDIYGMPYAVVGGTQAKKSVHFQYSSESDGVDHTTNQSFPFYPIPDEAITQPKWIEDGYPGNVDRRAISDRHLLIVDRDNRYLYELYNVFYDGAQWQAGSGAFFDMNRNDRRPDGWTSADAAGLAILPGLVRYDEVYGAAEIGHAFRFTVRATNGYVYPASHRAGSTSGALPMGARLRLKASTDISRFPADAQKIFRAMKKYGLIVADNGSDMYIGGTYDTRWNNSVLNPAFAGLTAADFEVVSLGYQGGGTAATPTITSTPTATPPAPTLTPSRTQTPSGGGTATPTRTPSATATATVSSTTAIPTVTATATPTPTPSSMVPTPTQTPRKRRTPRELAPRAAGLQEPQAPSTLRTD
ncbi:MAG TPA: hypothetical protein VE007_06830 [Thermoanaerobaculia bacterium]|nr:hypothetical protein [Thermoanaerobaculia bacterium]